MKKNKYSVYAGPLYVFFAFSLAACGGGGREPQSSLDQNGSTFPTKVPEPTRAPTPTPTNTSVVITNLAGSSSGFSDGTGDFAKFNYPMGVVSDRAGNIYVADYCNNRIRKITKSGVVSTYAGNGVAAYVDGPAISASFYLPKGIAIDKNENIYVADGNNKIRKIDRNGVVSTIAVDGLHYPRGIAVDGRGNIFISSSNKILKIMPEGVVKTVAGGNLAGFSDGVGELALFDQPQGIAVDQYGTIYVADSRNNRIRKIAENGAVTTLAGNRNASLLDGVGNSASFNYPSDVAIDALGQVYVVDAWNHRIRKVSQNGAVNTLSYLDGSLHAIAVSVDGSLYISRLLDSAEVITKIVY